ncbi:MAG: antitoxin family protein [Pirellulales bacterium]|nr:antitoxin family protein [Pirellulales bacterium]
MDQSIQAIYAQGVLRPLTPLDLAEGEVVTFVIEWPCKKNRLDSPPTSAGDMQREVLMRFIAKMESVSDLFPNDGLTNRDHDRLIYGA